MSLKERRISVPLVPVIVVVLLAVVVGGLHWFRDADRRRSAAACDVWVQHRAALESGVNEVDEAVGRARDAHTDVRREFNTDADDVAAQLRAWTSVAPAVLRSLHHGKGEDGAERGVWFMLNEATHGATEVARLVEAGDEEGLASWLDEEPARIHLVDRVCGDVWRA